MWIRFGFSLAEKYMTSWREGAMEVSCDGEWGERENGKPEEEVQMEKNGIDNKKRECVG